METIKISHRSDNQLKMTLKDIDGVLVSPAENWLKVYLQSGEKTFIATNDPKGEGTKYCHIEGEKLVLDIPSRRLGIGMIEYMIEVREDSQYFADGYKNTFSLEYTSINIEVV